MPKVPLIRLRSGAVDALVRLPPTERLLVTLCRRSGASELRAEHMVSLECAAVRGALHCLAETHGVLGLVLSTLERASLLSSLGREHSRDILAPLGHLRRQAAIWDLERARILGFLRRAGLDPVVLKGGALRDTTYDEPAQRPIGDLDLLLTPEAADDAIRVLETAGYREIWSGAVLEWYRRHHYHSGMAHPNGFVVEVHWGLTRPSRPWQLRADKFLRRSVLTELTTGVQVRTPSPEDMALHLASQNLEDHFSRLRRLVDLDRVIAREQGMDWAYLWKSAKDGRLEIVLAYSLQLCYALLRTSVPADFLVRLSPPRVARIHLALLRPLSFLVSQTSDESKATRRGKRFWLMVRWEDRLKYLVNRMWGPAMEHATARGLEDEADQREPSVRARLWAVAKFVAYFAAAHVGLYLSGFFSLVTRSGRSELRFWTAVEGDHGSDTVSTARSVRAVSK